MTSERTMWCWVLGLGMVVVTRVCGPWVVDSLDEVCATWRIAVAILGAAVVLVALTYRSNSKEVAEASLSIVPMMLVVALVVALIGCAYRNVESQIPELFRFRI